ncbi:Uncharacterised protein [Serratia fonticola]|uniref:hypothetical protein n=1 Tax=Serratia fonticola TaxID=47917 RepID=UPI00217749D3|nr:hypothetical protein [Serratia fonticola]CAI1847409.1 Uncharacterised protein [Serratia fonticola]
MIDEKQRFINKLEEALQNIKHTRYYETERGYQGELYAELRKILPDLGWDNAIVEQEYQKKIREHNIRIRPDIIIHVPFDPNLNNTRGDGNFVTFELKLGRNLTETQALNDYQSLAIMCEELSYPYAVFIVIDGNTTYFNKYDGPHKEKILAYNVNIVDGRVRFEREYAV